MRELNAAEDLNFFLLGHILFLKIVANKMCVPYKSEHLLKQGVLILHTHSQYKFKLKIAIG